MDTRPKIRNAVLVGALAAVTATAWATNDELSDYGYAQPEQAAVTATYEPVVVTEPVVTEPVVASESLSPTETVVTTTAPAPVVERTTVASAPITIEERRLSEDERIQAVVMDRLAQTNISGKIGVESLDSRVTLSGWTSTAMQADRAARTARGVIGVKYVENLIRPRIGGSAS